MMYSPLNLACTLDQLRYDADFNTTFAMENYTPNQLRVVTGRFAVINSVGDTTAVTAGLRKLAKGSPELLMVAGSRDEMQVSGIVVIQDPGDEECVTEAIQRWLERLTLLLGDKANRFRAPIAEDNPSRWHDFFRSIERVSRDTLADLSDMEGSQLHQCNLLVDPNCMCAVIGNLKVNSGRSWAGEFGSLTGQLLDPPHLPETLEASTSGALRNVPQLSPGEISVELALGENALSFYDSRQVAGGSSEAIKAFVGAASKAHGVEDTVYKGGPVFVDDYRDGPGSCESVAAFEAAVSQAYGPVAPSFRKDGGR